MHKHGRTEHAEDDVRPPLDIGKRRRDKIRQREIENPVRGRAQADALGSVFERKHLAAVDPARRRPGEAVDADEDVGAGDHAGRGRAADRPAQVGVAVDAGDGVSVGGHEAGDGEVQDAAEEGAGEEEGAAADAVDVGEHDAGCYQEDYVLDCRAVEGYVAGLRRVVLVDWSGNCAGLGWG